MPKINRDSINQIQIPTPPMTEQVAIENYLIEQTRRLDALLERIETAIARLTEYRAALITAAVTGQINVR